MNNIFSEKNRAFLLIALALVTLLAVLFLFRGKTSPYHAMPSQTAVVLELNSFLRVNQLKKSISDPARTQILETTAFRNAWQDIIAAEQLFRNDAALSESFARQKLLVGVTLNKADSLHGLFVLDAQTDLDIPNLLKTNTLTQKIFPSVFRGHILYTIHLSKQERLVVTAVGQLLLFSRFSYLVEDAITQLESSSSWWADRKFLPKLDENAPLRVFFRPAAIAAQFSNGMTTDWENVPNLIANNMEWLGVAWNGKNIVASAETKGFLAGLGAWGNAPQGNIFSVLPDNTALVAQAIFDNRRLFFEKIKTAESSDFDQFILPWAGNEAAWVLTEPFSQGMKDDQFILLAVRDSAMALERLRNYAQQRGALRAEEYQTFEVFEFASQSALKPLVGSGSDFRNPRCAMIGRYVVFANTRSAIELWIDKYIVNQTLANNTDLLQLLQKLPVGGNAQVLLNISYLPLLLKNLFDAEKMTFNPADIQAFANAGFVGIHFQPAANNNAEIHLAAQPLAGKTTQTSILWKTPLASLAATQPFVTRLPGENEGAAILIQDVQHQLYRLDAGGAVVWRRQMGSPILSAVQGIDYWANQTICYLFNTAGRIWLIDDKGRDVEGFPLELQSPATNGVVAVDFDNTLKFNYFIACANGNLYGYDHFGRPLPGWNPQGGVGRIVHPLAHFQRGGKDYLAALNQTGKLYVFGRNGAERFPAVQFSGKNFGLPQVDAASKSPRIVCANGAGAVFVCNLDGSMFNVSMGKGGNAVARLAFAPLSGDTRCEYALVQGKNVSVIGYEGAALKTLFAHQLPVQQDTVFVLPENRIGTLSRTKRQIFMFDSRGNLHPDFPLAGTTPFTTSSFFRKNSEQVLIVGEGSSVYAYKIR